MRLLLPAPVFVLPTINSVNLNQVNSASGNNIAVGSPFATQTLVQQQGNSATIAQGR
jgi:hypothetical protein